MNQTHKRNCACREHLNTEWKHQALKRNRDARLLDLKNTVRVQELAHHEDGVRRAKELEKNFREFAYTEAGERQVANDECSVPVDDVSASWGGGLDGAIRVHTW